MEKEWEIAKNSLSEIEVHSSKNNQLVQIEGHSEELRCIGIGTDAVVFQHRNLPKYAFKLYAKDKIEKLEKEKEIYKILGESEFFAKYYDAKGNYLVMSYEEGKTLYDCILQGIHIPNKIIEDVEEARKFAYNKGLNARDIHLKNIILQNNRAKVIDVSEYLEEGNDYRWEHLKKAYEEYYYLIDKKMVPLWVIESVRKWYNLNNVNTIGIDNFMKKVILFFDKK